VIERDAGSLVAVHIRSRAERGTSGVWPKYCFGSGVVRHGEPVERQVSVTAGTRIEFDLPATLGARANVVFTRLMLPDTVWGDDWIGGDHVVDVHIGHLRKKIDRFGHKHIKTVRGVGYRIQKPANPG